MPMPLKKAELQTMESAKQYEGFQDLLLTRSASSPAELQTHPLRGPSPHILYGWFLSHYRAEVVPSHS